MKGRSPLLLLASIVSLLLIFALPAFAQDETLPWNSPQRFSFGAGVNYAALHSAGADPQPAFLHEWRLGARLAWSAVPRVGIVGDFARGFDNRDVRFKIEPRLRLTSQTDPVKAQVGLGYEFINSQQAATSPTWRKQFKIGAYVGRGWNVTADKRTSVIAGLYSTYGVDDKDVEVGGSLRLAYTLHKGGYQP